MKFTKKIILFTLSLRTEVFMTGKARPFSWKGRAFQGYDFLYNCLLLPQSSIRAAILELMAAGFVEKISRNKRPFFKLTSLGKKQLSLFLPALFKPIAWDNKWWLVIVLNSAGSKNSKNSIKLKHFLEEKGFVCLQGRAYIGLENATRELIEHGWGGRIFVTSFNKHIYTNKELAERLWNLEKLGREGAEIIGQGQRLLSKLVRKKKRLKQTKLETFILIKSSFYLLQRLPSLPKQLLPADWPLEDLKKTILAFK